MNNKIQQFLLDDKLSQEQLRVLKAAIDKDINPSYFSLFANPDFQPQSMFILTKLSFLLDIEIFGLLANKYLTTRKLQYISDFILENKPQIEYVKYITNSRLSMSQISLILRELKNGIDIKLFEKVCDPALTISQIAKSLSKR
ncbi:hypothetical protein STIUS_v1c04510 [Spiroplasma sp. TIUS-1]|uniref:hypothetical protein n=1 Tax=Spiroplasma sp. TIUS-1 TaxID=216963 RepID=UPI00139892C5|nr:hypothetical protein [Spiroplasma sp. TIUS-1]QHX36005.1 hypothetical protein STIUS_v1c04510 [Spiroplasma sp. TIUS-1]